jgi:hypothetical protein
MSFGTEDFSDEGSTLSDDVQIPYQIKRTISTSKNTENYLAYCSKFNKTVGDDYIEKNIEKMTEFKLKEPFMLIEENLSKSNFDSSEESLNYDNLPNPEIQRQDNSIYIEIPQEVENQNNQNNQNNHENNDTARNLDSGRPNSFLNKKKKRNKRKKKRLQKKDKVKKDNVMQEIIRCFLNSYLKPKIEKKVKEYCILFFSSFPKKFIIEVKNNKDFLNYTLERILEEKKKYENEENRKFTNNVLELLKTIHFIDLENTFRNLYKEFLNSDAFKAHINHLIENKKISKAKAFAELSRKFIEE